MATALVVDDDRAVANLVKKVLALANFDEVLMAGNGAEGLAIWRSRHNDISLIITDYLMPVMDGLEMLNLVLAEDPEARIIVMTATPPEDGIPGVHALLVKPFDVNELLTVIGSLVQA